MADPVEADSTKPDSIKTALVAAGGDSARMLRDLLRGMQCMTVYDAPAAQFNPVTLAASGANVVIVDLTADAEVDAIYDLLDEQRYRVILNEAAVTSRLSGWEHARWARHLAAKILDRPDVVDPPRPNEGTAAFAPVVSVTAAHAAPRALNSSAASDNAVPPVAEIGIDDWLSEVMQGNDPAASFVFAQPGASADVQAISDDESPVIVAESANGQPSPVAIRNNELDALMASAIPTPGPDDEAESAPFKPAAEERFEGQLEDVIREIDDWLPASVPSGELRNLAAAANARLWSSSGTSPVDTGSADNDESAGGSSESTPGLQPTSLSDDARLELLPPAAAANPRAPSVRAQPMAHPTPLPADRAVAFASPAVAASRLLELAPLGDSNAAPLVDAPALEDTLVLENEPELPIDAAQSDAPSRVVVLCASVGGPEAIRELLGALPSHFPAVFLVVQQVGEEFLDMLSQQLRRATTLRVRGAALGEQLRDGDVIPVSPRQRLLVDRSGRVVASEKLEEGTAASVNQLLRDVSDNFDEDCAVVVLSGIASDLTDGCRYLAGRGGRVYAQTPSSCVASAMVEQVQQAGVVSFLGTPAELAAHLMVDHA